jgi:transcriptional regulator with XRE-family HTH domain
MTQTPNPVDVHVGKRLRLRRTLLGLSQEKLGEHLGLTFQQVQKYERGTNRIGSSRLYRLSRVLEVPVSYFFEDLDDPMGPPTGSVNRHEGPAASNPMERRETLELVRAYYRIDDVEVRRRVLDLVKALSAAPRA